MVCGLFRFSDCDVIPLVCSFQAPYYYSLLRDTLSFHLHVLEPPCISLDSLQGHTLSSDKVITLTSIRYYNKGITLLSTAGNPTPNGLHCSWDFLSGQSPNTLAGPTSSTPYYHRKGLLLINSLHLREPLGYKYGLIFSRHSHLLLASPCRSTWSLPLTYSMALGQLPNHCS